MRVTNARPFYAGFRLFIIPVQNLSTREHSIPELQDFGGAYGYVQWQGR